MRAEGTIWEMRSPGNECNCGCVIHVAGDVNHSQDVCAVAQHWWPMGWHGVDSVLTWIFMDFCDANREKSTFNELQQQKIISALTKCLKYKSRWQSAVSFFFLFPRIFSFLFQDHLSKFTELQRKKTKRKPYYITTESCIPNCLL